MKIFGLDLSLDHGGFVVLNGDGRVVDYAYLTAVKKSADIDPEHSILLSKRGKEEPKETFRLRRMGEYLQDFADFEQDVRVLNPIGGGLVVEKFGDSIFSIEGYSYASQSTSMCQIAELTGHIKHMIFEEGGKIRVHDPLSVKLFATGGGNCTKKNVVEEAMKHFGIPEGLIKKTKKKVRGKKILYVNPTLRPGFEPTFGQQFERGTVEEYDGPATDLADAYFLARMIYKELQLRQGNILLSQLHEGERRIFLRVTKANPINILDRDFVHKATGE